MTRNAISRALGMTALAATAVVATTGSALAGAVLTPNYSVGTSAPTTSGDESNSLTIYLDARKPSEVGTYASVRHMNYATATGSFSGRMTESVCDSAGTCSVVASTSFRVVHNNQDSSETPANWLPTAKTPSGLPVKSVVLHVVIDTAYVVDGIQPADVVNTIA